MLELTSAQYQIVYNAFSLAIACMFASFVYFVLVRNEVAKRYRGAVIASALVVFIAGYHYFRIFNSWEGAFHISATRTYIPTGNPFNDLYRYVDWILTVPLLMVELVIVMALSKKETSSLLFKLVIAAFLMVALGYPGEMDKTSTTIFSSRGFWGLMSTIPFLYILATLIGKLRAQMGKTTPEIAVLLRNAALLTVFTWGFYPIAFMAPFYGATGAHAEVTIQLGYTIADILAKCGYGLLIHRIAVLRSETEIATA